ncbi:hypothetical protein PENFLA_c020G09916 [Penicillium flavigenum]|uniref:Uncharacterized protein n=1 Tax=Penicillium flavigenum TaxID=254877 RepID=A0A1V6SY64_9EURO|nr:hypothetical protein PENFLA_c020G09916 [Penicillium flavigenum]
MEAANDSLVFLQVEEQEDAERFFDDFSVNAGYDTLNKRQYFILRSNKRFKTELQLDTAIDAVGSDHQDMAILLGDFDKRSKSTLLRMTHIEGYHVECSDKSTNPGTLPPDQQLPWDLPVVSVGGIATS